MYKIVKEVLTLKKQKLLKLSTIDLIRKSVKHLKYS